MRPPSSASSRTKPPITSTARRRRSTPRRCLDTPKTVTVIPQQVIKDTGARPGRDAPRTTWYHLRRGEGGNPAGDRPFIRGFNAESDTFLGRYADVASQTREVFNVEQIEVSKAGLGLHRRRLHRWQPEP
ncbi:hypothetical protein P4133_13250 [Pseudomonas aeruginosa]|nr:hypothetical protein [Pseudomonas aeruginosa]